MGWRGSWGRVLPLGISWSAPGLAAPRPPGRCGSLPRGAWPGGRARVARAPALPRGARSSRGGARGAGRASAARPIARYRQDQRRSRARPALALICTSRSRNLAVGMPETARRNPRPRRPRTGWPGSLAAFGACPGKVEVLDHNCPRALFPRGGDDGADRVAEPPVPRGGGQPGQVQRHRERRACHVPVSCHDGDGEVAGVDVDRHDRMRPEFAQRRGRPGDQRSSMTRRGTSAPKRGPC